MGSVVFYGVFGAAVGWGSLFITVLMAKGKKRRTQVRVRSQEDLSPLIRNWCAANGYKLRSEAGNRWLYQRGSGFWQAAARLEVSQQGDEWVIEGFLYLTSLINSAELAFDETGAVAKLPRDNRKKEFNVLLQQLGASALG